MVTMEQIRKDMAPLLKTEQELHFVEVQADSLDEALADAAVQLDCHVSSLEYEVLERGFEGFLGLAKKPWSIKVYQNAETIAKTAKINAEGFIEDGNESEENIIRDKDAEFFVHRFGTEICLKVTMPIGEGKKVNPDDILAEVRRSDTVNFDEKRIRNAAENGTNDSYISVGSYSHNPASDALFVIEISKDEMTATITISPPEISGSDVSENMIRHALKTQGVLDGYNDEKMTEAVDKPVYNAPMVVAESNAPKDGKDAYIIYNFETDKKKIRAKENASGQINFKELNLIQNVVQGQPLAEKVMAEKGKAGKTLFGRYLEAKDGRDIPMPLGKNVEVDTDGRTIIASCNGQVLLINDKIYVEPVMEVDAVNISTGNITYLGTVICKGNVEDGYDIKASGNIEIGGAVGKCHIESDGDVVVSQGVMGRDEGVITCGGTLWAKFIQNTQVKAGANVIVSDSIMNSDVTAQKKIVLNGKRAQITGGHLFATEVISAKNIGSNGGGTETVLEVGFDPKAKQRLAELQDIQSSNARELDELELNISTLENLKKVRRTIPKDKEQSLVEFCRRRDEIIEQNEEVNAEISKIQERLRELKVVGKVCASGTVYAGVKVYVRDEKDEVIADVKNVTFYYENGFVRRGKYEDPDLSDITDPPGYS